VRTNHLFLKILRKHFLDWRVVSEVEKLQYLQRARHLLGADPKLLAEEETRIQARIEALQADDEPEAPAEEAGEKPAQ